MSPYTVRSTPYKDYSDSDSDYEEVERGSVPIETSSGANKSERGFLGSFVDKVINLASSTEG
jgi:hypothetical protein